MDHIGIDVHKRESQLCILDRGRRGDRAAHSHHPERFAAVLGARPRARILLEASTESESVARCLERLGHEVIVADPNFVPMYATRTRTIKTDRRDALRSRPKEGASVCQTLQGEVLEEVHPAVLRADRQIDAASAAQTAQSRRDRLHEV